MSRFALSLALLCAVAQSAQALQLGETKEQLLKQNGAPGAEDHARNLAVYFWEGWSAQLEFRDDVVQKITYRRNWYLQDTEITSLLESNGGAARWKETSLPNGLARQWTRDDGASATCGRSRPLNIVFQTAGLAAAYQQGPKVVVPAPPGPASASTAYPQQPYGKAPNFPRQLTAVEPDLPVADPPAPSPALPQAERPLPKLKAAEVGAARNAASANAAPAPSPESSVENKSAPQPSGAAPGDDPNLLGYAFASFACLAAFGLGGFYIYKLRSRQRSTKPPAVKVIPVDSPRAALSASASARTDSLRSDQVELLIGEIFRRDGYTIELSAALNTDDGIDLMLRRDSETTLVQCKHWAAPRVTGREVRDFYSAMAAGGAPHGILVTTGAFTPDALDFAPTKGIELLDGTAVAAKIKAVSKPGENLYSISTWIDDFVAHARIFDPECPVCHNTMVIRNNRASGAPWWSCRNHPRCPGRREPRLDLLPSSAAS